MSVPREFLIYVSCDCSLTLLFFDSVILWLFYCLILQIVLLYFCLALLFFDFIFLFQYSLTLLFFDSSILCFYYSFIPLFFDSIFL